MKMSGGMLVVIHVDRDSEELGDLGQRIPEEELQAAGTVMSFGSRSAAKARHALMSSAPAPGTP
jgi:hypothetical protein